VSVELVIEDLSRIKEETRDPFDMGCLAGALDLIRELDRQRVSAEMIAPLLEQLTAQAEKWEAMADLYQSGSPSRYEFLARAGAFTDAAVLVSTWAAGVQS
jgi:hypothetical protein